jgi:hypothetical protein
LSVPLLDAGFKKKIISRCPFKGQDAPLTSFKPQVQQLWFALQCESLQPGFAFLVNRKDMLGTQQATIDRSYGRLCQQLGNRFKSQLISFTQQKDPVKQPLLTA